MSKLYNRKIMYYGIESVSTELNVTDQIFNKLLQFTFLSSHSIILNLVCPCPSVQNGFRVTVQVQGCSADPRMGEEHRWNESVVNWINGDNGAGT